MSGQAEITLLHRLLRMQYVVQAWCPAKSLWNRTDLAAAASGRASGCKTFVWPLVELVEDWMTEHLPDSKPTRYFIQLEFKRGT